MIIMMYGCREFDLTAILSILPLPKDIQINRVILDDKSKTFKVFGFSKEFKSKEIQYTDEKIIQF